jgi:queuine tRNA-ribosyltransferase
MLQFVIEHQSKKSRARAGRIITPHGDILTPTFVPVATNACLKAIDHTLADELSIGLMFCNTYHLMLHPGSKIVAAAGGLHSFMKRSGPLITDSGGFQVFSLAYGGVHQELKSQGTKKQSGGVIKITEEGVLFRSYRDGSRLLLTPETSVQAQKELGADIIIPLDELPPYHIDQRTLRRSFDRTHRWQLRSLAEHLKDRRQQSMYAVVHGGVDPNLRTESVALLTQHAFDGLAIGGSLGKNRDEMVTMLMQLMPHMPAALPRHLLGIADLPSIDSCVPLGIDTFDSSHPTKCARHGLLFTDFGMVNITKGSYKQSFKPVDASCTCRLCTHYTAAYLHHLFKAHEPAALTLASMHNIHYMMRLFARYRERIFNDEI